MRVKFPLVYYILESARGVIWSRKRNGTIDRGHLPSTFFQKRGLASDDAWIVDVSCEKLGGKGSGGGKVVGNPGGGELG